MFSCVSLNELFISSLTASIIFMRRYFRLESSSSGVLGDPGLAVEGELCLMVPNYIGFWCSCSCSYLQYLATFGIKWLGCMRAQFEEMQNK